MDMHKRAEYGVAAHWKYKERQVLGSKSSDEILPDENMAWLAHITDWEGETEDPSEFLDTLRYEIGAKEVYVFTPKGKVIGLSVGATPVDFGYAVHTEIGHRVMGAKVNGRLVPLDTQLGSGDTVEVLTSKNPEAGPSQDWLNFATSQRARSKIRSWFTKERRDDAIESGREALAKVVRKKNLSLSRVLSAQNLASVATGLKYENVDSLYAALGEGQVSTQSVLEKIMVFVNDVEHDDDSVFVVPTRKPTATRDNDSGVLVRGAADILVKLAKCCTPVPGDGIAGFITRGNGVSVHREDCPNVKGFDDERERMIEVEWAGTSSTVFRVHIQVEALDRGGLLSDITRVLSEHHVNILTATVQTDSQRLATSRFVFEMSDTTHLDRVLSAVRRIDAVYDVYRVNAG
jgi:GTP pyrophosphokinase